MRIKSADLAQRLERGEPVNLQFGAGPDRMDGYFNLDIDDAEHIDVVADLNEPLALLPDSSVAEIYTSHTLEHIQNLAGLMAEIHRILRPGGRLHAEVPHFSSPYAMSDPTHVRFFGLYTMYYFVPQEHQPAYRKVPDFYGTHAGAKFTIDSIRIGLYSRSLLGKLLFPMTSKRLNSSFENQDLYERRYCQRYPAWDITYVMRPLK